MRLREYYLLKFQLLEVSRWRLEEADYLEVQGSREEWCFTEAGGRGRGSRMRGGAPSRAAFDSLTNNWFILKRWAMVGRGRQTSGRRRNWALSKYMDEMRDEIIRGLVLLDLTGAWWPQGACKDWEPLNSIGIWDSLYHCTIWNQFSFYFNWYNP